MRIPETTIDEVRGASDIVDVVSAAVSLKKRGKSYVGLCPFHQEKTPSFTVSPERQMYHCFGCRAGGNVFSFVMAREKLSFVEAVHALADRAGIAIPASGGGSDDDAASAVAPKEKARRRGRKPLPDSLPRRNVECGSAWNKDPAEG